LDLTNKDEEEGGGKTAVKHFFKEPPDGLKKQPSFFVLKGQM
jgi:hypothetical protein